MKYLLKSLCISVVVFFHCHLIADHALSGCNRSMPFGDTLPWHCHFWAVQQLYKMLKLIELNVKPQKCDIRTAYVKRRRYSKRGKARDMKKTF